MPLSWQEIEAVVRKSRAEQLQNVAHCPTNLQFYNGYIFFIGAVLDSDFNENTIFYVNLANTELLSESDGSEKAGRGCWVKLLSEEDDGEGDLNVYSREEELLRERKRLSAHGINSFDFHLASGKLLFSSGKRLYVADVNAITTGQQKHVHPVVIRSSLESNRMDTKLCLINPSLVSFVHSGDLWVVNSETGLETRLTFARATPSNDVVSAGVPSYVMQEEFDRFTAYWWQPQQQAPAKDETTCHRILYEFVDESGVDEVHVISPCPWPNVTSSVDVYRYPKAGNQNAKSLLKIVEFSFAADEFIDGSLCEYILRSPLQEAVPWVEYIVNCGWMPHSNGIWLIVLNRLQTRQALLHVPMTSFKMMNDSGSMSEDPSKASYEIMWEESMPPVWINASCILKFLREDNPNHKTFIWSSEKSGFRHLYLRKVLIGAKAAEDNNTVTECPVVMEKQLTSGDWEVTNEKIWVDEACRVVYFMGTKDTPLEQHLYAVRLDDPCEIFRLTELGYSNEVSIDSTCWHAVVSSSSLYSPLKVGHFQLKHPSVLLKGQAADSEEMICMLQKNWIDASRSLLCEPVVEQFQYQNCHGYTMYGLLFKPKEIEADTKYPTVLFVYGGPHVQLVTNSQKSVRRFLFNSLTALGYAVVVIDTIGSAHRGVVFESHLKNSMGVVEIEDQVFGLEHIAAKSGIIDMERVAIHGWSYGGYLALMGLARRPDVFKLAIAGAPVTAWELYDTGYTERYIGLPKNNRHAYFAGSVLSYIHNFPNEQNRLLLVHGLTDENVHFSHTAALISCLVKEGKPYQLQIYPNERHGLRQPSSAHHHETSMLWFIQEGFAASKNAKA